MGIEAGLSAIKTGAELVKTLREGLKNGTIPSHEIAGRIGEVYDYLIDSKGALLDTQEEIQNLKAEIKECKDANDLNSRLDFDGHVYWLSADGKWDGPFCPVCWDGSKTLVRLEHGRSRSDGNARFDCNIHARLFITVLRAQMVRPFFPNE